MKRVGGLDGGGDQGGHMRLRVVNSKTRVPSDISAAPTCASHLCECVSSQPARALALVSAGD